MLGGWRSQTVGWRMRAGLNIMIEIAQAADTRCAAARFSCGDFDFRSLSDFRSLAGEFRCG
jgi:hypothetical protein